MAESKRIKYQIVGTVDLKDGVDLETATGHLKALAEKAREYGTADVSMSVPRMTKVKV